MDKFISLRDELNKWNIPIDDESIDAFETYFDLLISWNDKINLTAITDENGVLYKHFLDSLSLMKYTDLAGMKILDVGTGAGFPGIPLAIMNPDAEFVLLDSLNKRITYLNEVINSLGLTNVKCFHGRAEDFAYKKDFRESFDIVVSRAVANLSTLSEYCIPFVKKGGKFISYKSEKSDEEIKSALKAISILGGKKSEIFNYDLNYDDTVHRLVIVDKVKKTGRHYPRKAGTPSKSPL